jgi:hypothetical protein
VNAINYISYAINTMTHVKQYLIVILLYGLGAFQVQAQEGIHATGGEASGSGGSASYSVGQVFWNTVSGTNESIVEGVQQPFEISVSSPNAIIPWIHTELKVFPNPTSRSVNLLIDTQDLKDLRFQLYDINGRCILEGNLESDNTEIPFEAFSPSTYLLKILKADQNIRTFKIIKN